MFKAFTACGFRTFPNQGIFGNVRQEGWKDAEGRIWKAPEERVSCCWMRNVKKSPSRPDPRIARVFAREIVTRFLSSRCNYLDFLGNTRSHVTSICTHALWKPRTGSRHICVQFRNIPIDDIRR